MTTSAGQGPAWATAIGAILARISHSHCFLVRRELAASESLCFLVLALALGSF